MAYVRDIRDLANFYRSLTGRLRKATARALLRVAVNATTKAKRNAKDRFKGTAERPRSGNLSNAIFAGFTLGGRGEERHIASAMVAVRSQKGDRGTRPYGRIQEYGGPIKPKKAKNLWLPLTGPKTSRIPGNFKNMTPRDFMAAIAKQKKSKALTSYPVKGKSKKAVPKNKKVRSIMGTFTFLRENDTTLAGFDKVSGRGKTARHKFIALFMLRKQVTIPGKRYVNDAVDEEFPQFKKFLDKEDRKSVV